MGSQARAQRALSRGREIFETMALRRRAGRPLRLAWGVVLCLAWVGCAGLTKPVPACLSVTSGPALNTYDGQPHVVVLSIIALESTLGFEDADVRDLLENSGRVAGVVGPRLELTLAPSETRTFRESMPPTTQKLGIVADYYRAQDDPPGNLKAVVKATCGWFGTPKLVLTPKDLLVL